jgi:hypothetical protein
VSVSGPVGLVVFVVSSVSASVGASEAIDKFPYPVLDNHVVLCSEVLCDISQELTGNLERSRGSESACPNLVALLDIPALAFRSRTRLFDWPLKVA